ncbi:MAG: hypothetical protein ABH814_02750 [bacterium]
MNIGCGLPWVALPGPLGKMFLERFVKQCGDQAGIYKFSVLPVRGFNPDPAVWKERVTTYEHPWNPRTGLGYWRDLFSSKPERAHLADMLFFDREAAKKTDQLGQWGTPLVMHHLVSKWQGNWLEVYPGLGVTGQGLLAYIRQRPLKLVLDLHHIQRHPWENETDGVFMGLWQTWVPDLLATGHVTMIDVQFRSINELKHFLSGEEGSTVRDMLLCAKSRGFDGLFRIELGLGLRYHLSMKRVVATIGQISLALRNL